MVVAPEFAFEDGLKANIDDISSGTFLAQMNIFISLAEY
jgi:hypothetical protein